MNFYSLNNKSARYTFREAVLGSIAPDGGLFFPEHIPSIQNISEKLHALSVEDLCCEFIQPFVGNEIPSEALRSIVDKTLSFPLPIKQVSDKKACLELFHGPTMAFKDIGARFLAECIGTFSGSANTTVLVATSGDTGGAVANGFLGVKGVRVVILYPKGMVSRLQEKQLTTLGDNIHAIAVDADFDTCQALVKQCFADVALKQELGLTSANSINVARWLPQMFYYIAAVKQLHPAPITFVVPSGNFGNVCAGIMAYAMGLPVQHFIAATNMNDTVPRFLKTGNYMPQPTHKTISNAMDISDPSNFIRIREIAAIKGFLLNGLMTPYSISDEETYQMLHTLYHDYHYEADPHTAVAFAAAEQHAKLYPTDTTYVVLGTAHPIKFEEALKPVYTPNLPDYIRPLLNKKMVNTLQLPADFGLLKKHLLSL